MDRTDRILTEAELAALLEESPLGREADQEGQPRGPDQRGGAFSRRKQRVAFHRRLFAATLDVLLSQARAVEQPLSVMKVRLNPLDHRLPEADDLEVDRALSRLGAVLRRSSRISDLVLVSDENEFGVIADGQSKSQVILMAERCRGSVEECFSAEYFQSSLGSLTASVGLSTYPEDSLEAAELLFLADESVSRAALSGGNRVISAGLGLRHHPRLPLGWPVQLIPAASKGPVVSGAIADISLGGFSVILDPRIEIDGLQRVCLDDPDSLEPSWLLALPVWRRADQPGPGGHLVGFVFQPPSRETRETVQALIWRRLRPAESICL